MPEKWEYIFRTEQPLLKMDTELNRLGQVGWEAYAVTGGANGAPLTVWLKRRESVVAGVPREQYQGF